MKTISRKTIRNTSTRPVTSWQNCWMKTLSSHWHRFRRSYHVFTVNFSDRHLNNMEDEIEFLVSAPPLSTWVRNWLFQIKIKTYRRIRNTSTDTKKPYGKDREMDILCCYEKHKSRYIARENRRSKLGKWLWLKKMNKMEHTRILESSKTYIPEKNIKVRALKQSAERAYLERVVQGLFAFELACYFTPPAQYQTLNVKLRKPKILEILLWLHE